MRWPETLIRNWADRFTQKRASANHQPPAFRPRGGCSKHRQAGYLHIGMLLARWAGKKFTIRDLFLGSEPGVHFETYDPNTILRRRNLLTWSEDLSNPAWTFNNSSASSNATNDPTGAATADKIVETNPGGSIAHEARTPSLTYDNGRQYTLSVYGKAAERTFLRVGFSSAVASGSPFVVFNLSTGAVAAVQGTPTHSITDAGGGWWRCSVTVTITTGASATCFIGPNVDGTVAGAAYVGDPAKGIYVWGAQVDKDAVASNYQKVTDWDTEFMAAGGERVTMFRDNEGFAPVTAIDQIIGAFISTERGTDRGPQKVTDTNFASPGSWTITQPSSGSVTISGNQCVINSVDGSFAAASIPAVGGIVVGKSYEYIVEVAAIIGGGCSLSLGGQQHNFTTVGRRRGFITATATSAVEVKRFSGAPSGGTFTFISVREIPGSVARQTTSGMRPKLDARVNQYVKSEDLSDSAWTKSSVTVSGRDRVIPAVTNIGFKEVQQTFTGVTAVAYTYRVKIKGDGYNFVQLLGTSGNFGSFAINFDLGSGTETQYTPGTSTIVSRSITSAGAGYYWLSVTIQCLTGASTCRLGFNVIPTATSARGDAWASDGASGVLVAAQDVRTAADAALDIPAYQRVNTSTDYDSEGFPHRVRHDAADDFLSVPLNLSATDKLTVWISGSLKVADDASRILVEHTTNSNTVPGGFNISAPPAAAQASYGIRSGGSVTAATTSSAAYPAPRNEVLAMGAEIATDTLFLDVNGVQNVTSASDQGTGNYANDTLYIGARAGSSLRSGCGWTALTIRGASTDARRRMLTTRLHARLAKINL